MSTIADLPDGRQVKLDNLQILRALGALIVVTDHSIIDVIKLYSNSNLFDPWPGTFGVEVFFFISGFIIALTTWERFETRGATGQFLWQRFWRLVPLYWLATSLYLVIAAASPGAINRPPASATYIVASYLFIPAKNSIGTLSPAYALGWSLNFEMLFYVTFALLMRWPIRRALIALSIPFVALTCAHRFFAVGSIAEYLSRGYLVDFVVGAWASMLARNISFRLPSFCFLLGVTALLAVAALYFRGWVAEDYRPTIITAGLGIAIGFLGVFCRTPRGVFFITAPLIAIGNASYSLYLCHMFVVRFGLIAANKVKLLHVLPDWLTWLMLIITSILVSFLSYRYLERPFTRLGRNFLTRIRAGTRLV